MKFYRLYLFFSVLAVVGLLFVSSCSKTKESTSKPNIIIILADDMGYSDLGCFGSEITTPNLDTLAAGGVRMTQFYNAARCCPTRASLLTGLYPHQVGMGDMVEGRLLPDSTPLQGYTGYLSDQCVTMAEVLKQEGYRTMISGKWHVGDDEPHWPHKRGFDDVYTLINGCTNYFTLAPWFSEDQEILVRDGNDTVTAGDDYYLTNAITDHALEFLDQKPADQPFFLYLAHAAPHWPLHALPEDIALFEGSYMEGWDAMRKQRYERMKEMGIIPAGTELPDRYLRRDLTPVWESLSPEEKATFDRRMAVHAAMIYRMDQGIGVVVEKLKEMGEFENTLIMFLSDNGATEATIYLVESWPVDRSGPIGSARSFDSQGPSWAQASNSPMQLFKSYSMEGGINTSFIAHWPGHIPAGRIDHTPAHIIDIMATVVDASGAEYPGFYEEEKIIPSEGSSLLPIWSGDEQQKDFFAERPIFVEHMGNRAVRYGKWKLVYLNKERFNPGKRWALYDLAADRNEMQDVSSDHPDMVTELEAMYENWADRVGVYAPYDSLILARHL